MKNVSEIVYTGAGYSLSVIGKFLINAPVSVINILYADGIGSINKILKFQVATICIGYGDHVGTSANIYRIIGITVFPKIIVWWCTTLHINPCQSVFSVRTGCRLRIKLICQCVWLINLVHLVNCATNIIGNYEIICTSTYSVFKAVFGVP